MNKKIFMIVKCLLVLLCFLFFTTQKEERLASFTSNFAEAAVAQNVDKEQVYALDINKLEQVQSMLTSDKEDITGFPKDIIALRGKRVKVTGYLLIPYDAYLSKKSFDSFAVGKNAYGCPCCDWNSSPPPTIFNTIMVKLKKGGGISAPFTPLVEVTGIFSTRHEYYTDDDGKKRLNTLFYIQEAKAEKKKQGFLKNLLY